MTNDDTSECEANNFVKIYNTLHNMTKKRNIEGNIFEQNFLAKIIKLYKACM